MGYLVRENSIDRLNGRKISRNLRDGGHLLILKGNLRGKRFIRINASA
jgi:hypothetical protein